MDRLTKRLDDLEHLLGSIGCHTCCDWSDIAIRFEVNGVWQPSPFGPETWPVDDPVCPDCQRRPSRLHQVVIGIDPRGPS